MSKGFCNVSHSGNGSIDYYGRAEECTYIIHSNKQTKTFEELRTAWKTIEQHEVYGNAALGIRGRHDARVRTNYILSMPNELSARECAERVKLLAEQTKIKDCTYTIFVHKGEKEGIVNQHVHLLVNERDLVTRKKDRTMQRKEWLEKTFRPLYEQTFAKEMQEGISVSRRERISTELYKADPQVARAEIKKSELKGQEQIQDWMRDFAKGYEAGKAEHQKRLEGNELSKAAEHRRQESIPQMGRGLGIKR
jgi:MobA/MobL family